MKLIAHQNTPRTQKPRRRLVTIDDPCVDTRQDLGPEWVHCKHVNRRADPNGDAILVRYLLFEAMLRRRPAGPSLRLDLLRRFHTNAASHLRTGFEVPSVPAITGALQAHHPET